MALLIRQTLGLIASAVRSKAPKRTCLIRVGFIDYILALVIVGTAIGGTRMCSEYTRGSPGEPALLFLAYIKHPMLRPYRSPPTIVANKNLVIGRFTAAILVELLFLIILYLTLSHSQLEGFHNGHFTLAISGAMGTLP